MRNNAHVSCRMTGTGAGGGLFARQTKRDVAFT
jgi:hypothetical protein